jgi:23S rRNA G2445 N2-methylase RlmL
VPDCQAITKKAIVERLRRAYNEKGWLASPCANLYPRLFKPEPDVSIVNKTLSFKMATSTGYFAEGNFPVQGRSVKSTLHSVPDCQAITKKAIVERLRRAYNEKDPRLFKPEPDVSIVNKTLSFKMATSTGYFAPDSFNQPFSLYARIRTNQSAPLGIYY